MTKHSSIGAVLRQARKAVGMSQDAAAREIGVASITISRWERNVSQPSGPNLVRARQVYGLTDDDPGSMREDVRKLQERVSALEDEVADLRRTTSSAPRPD